MEYFATVYLSRSEAWAPPREGRQGAALACPPGFQAVRMGLLPGDFRRHRQAAGLSPSHGHRIGDEAKAVSENEMAPERPDLAGDQDFRLRETDR